MVICASFKSVGSRLHAWCTRSISDLFKSSILLYCFLHGDQTDKNVEEEMIMKIMYLPICNQIKSVVISTEAFLCDLLVRKIWDGDLYSITRIIFLLMYVMLNLSSLSFCDIVMIFCDYVCLLTVSLAKNQRKKDIILLWLTTQHGSSTLWMARQTLSISKQILM